MGNKTLASRVAATFLAAAMVVTATPQSMFAEDATVVTEAATEMVSETIPEADSVETRPEVALQTEETIPEQTELEVKVAPETVAGVPASGTSVPGAETNASVETQQLPEEMSQQTEAMADITSLSAKTSGIKATVSLLDGRVFADGMTLHAMSLSDYVEEFALSEEEKDAITSAVRVAWKDYLTSSYINAHPGTWTTEDANMVSNTILQSAAEILPMYLYLTDASGQMVNVDGLRLKLRLSDKTAYSLIVQNGYDGELALHENMSGPLGVWDASILAVSGKEKLDVEINGFVSGWYSFLVKNPSWTYAAPTETPAGETQETQDVLENTVVDIGNVLVAEDLPDEDPDEETPPENTVVDMNPVTEPQTEDQTESVTEDESDLPGENIAVDTETEAAIIEEETEEHDFPAPAVEIAELSNGHKVYIADEEAYTISFEDPQEVYEEGDTVTFSITAIEGYSVDSIEAYEIENSVFVDEEFVAEKEYDEEENPFGEYLTLGDSVEYEVLSAEEESVATLSFSMPDADVYLTAAVEESSEEAADIFDEEMVSLEAVAADSSTPAKGSYSYGSGSWIAYPTVFTSGTSSGAGTTKRTFKLMDSSGKKIISKTGYCIQPTMESPSPSGSLREVSDEQLIKGLFYLYGGPAWNKTIKGTDGASYNLKSYFDSYGFSTDQIYAVCHVILSKLYYNASSTSGWSWNAGWTEGAEGHIVSPAFNSTGTSFVSKIQNILKVLPLPTESCTVSENTFKTGDMVLDTATNRYKTPSILFDCSVARNRLHITVPANLIVVDETTNKSYAAGSEAIINGGDTFHFEATSMSLAGTINVDATADVYANFTAYVYRSSESYQQNVGLAYTDSNKTFTFSLEFPNSVKVKVKKTSANSAITNGNSNYSLARAEFEIRNSSGSVAGKVTTTANGTSNEVELEPGTYTLVETKAPKGFLKAADTKFTVSAGTESMEVTVSDEPIVGTFEVLLEKIVKDGYNTSISKGGAQFKIEFYDGANASGTLLRNWVFQTTAKGAIEYDALHKVSGDDLYGDNRFPLGSVKITEVKPPTGFNLDSTPQIVNITQSGEKAVFSHTEDTSVFLFADAPQFGGIKVQKLDAENTSAQGNGTLAGTVFAIVSENDYTINLADDKTTSYSKGEEVCRITTDSTGKAQTPTVSVDGQTKELLQAGTYTIKEVAAPDGYKLGNYSYTFTITEDGQVIDATASPAENQVMRGGFTLQKWDQELNAPERVQGDATLEGAKFTLTNQSTHEVLVDTDGDGAKEVYASGAVIATFETDEKGLISTATDFLPYGSYNIKETTPPTGYTKNGEDLDIDFDITEDGQQHSFTTEDTAAKNRVIRFDITIIKFRDTLSSVEPGDDVEPIEGVVFDIYLKSELEANKNASPVLSITTDADGVATTVDAAYPYGRLPYGVYTVKESKYPADVIPVSDFDVYGTEEGGVYDGKEYKGIYKNDRPVEEYLALMKVDAETGKTVSGGAKFQILDSDKNVISFKVSYPKHETITDFVTQEDGIVTLPERLPFGTYYLHEVTAPEGYIIGADLQFSVTTRNSWENVITIPYGDSPAKGKIRITKRDEDTAESVSGAVYAIFANADIVTGDGTIRANKGDLVGTIITGSDGTGISEELYLGSYYLQEAKAPEGYCLDTMRHPVTLTYADQETPVVYADIDLTNAPTTLDLFKQNEDGDVIADVTFSITRIGDLSSSGITNPLSVTGGDFVTDENGLIEIKYLVSGLYKIVEKETLPGYILDTAPHYFVVTTNGFIFESDQNGNNLDEDDAQADTETITWSNKYTKIDFSKVNVNGDAEIPGAKMAIYTTDKSERLYDWISTDQPHRINMLPTGKYILVEELAPEGFVIATEMPFEVKDTEIVQKVTMVDKQVLFHKFDITGSAEIPGAHIQVFDDSSQIVDEWISGEEPHAICGLEEGMTYTLHEDVAANGYVIATDVDFTVGMEKVDEEVSLTDKQVFVLKVDASGNPVYGAMLEAVDETDQVIDRWLTDGKPHAVSGMIVGEYYIIREASVPEGYVSAHETKILVMDDNQNQELIVTDKKVAVRKVNADGEAVSGAKYAVYEVIFDDSQENGYRIAEDAADAWTTDENAYYVNNLVAGKTYLLVEEEAPRGYVKASSVFFTVNDDGQDQEIIVKEKQVINSKVDSCVNQLAGAEIEVLDEAYEQVDHWISDGEPHAISGLEVGKTYILREIAAPEGYVLAAPITFTVSDDAENELFDLINKQVLVYKSDITGTNELPGADLDVKDAITGEVKDNWTSTLDPHPIKGLEVGKTYILREQTAPEGYVVAEEITFTVMDDGTLQKVVMKDKQVGVSKQDITTGAEIEGALLTVLTMEDAVVDTWTSEEGKVHYVNGLKVGETYKLREETAPEGYSVAEEITFYVANDYAIQTVVMKDVPTKAEFTKSSVTDGKPVIGATLVITSGDTEITRWITTEEPHVIEKLPAGKYTLTEVSAPDGYLVAESIDFEIFDDGTITKVDMKDDVTKVKITKTDLTTGKPVIGAELVINKYVNGKEGDEVARWITKEEPYYIEALPVGDYVLTEITAPNGYEVAEKIIFSVKETGEIQTVEMKDAPITKTTTTTPTPTYTPTTTTTSTTTAVSAPKTGLNSNSGWFALLSLAFASLGLILLRKKKEAA